jgi:predicted PurR-regulated permease PerM
MQERTLELSLGSLTRVLFGAVGLLLLLLLRDILGLVLLAVVLTASITPLLRWFDGEGIPRGLGVAAVLLLLTAVFAVLLVVLLPPLLHQIGLLDVGLPQILDQVRVGLRAVGITVPIDFGSSVSGSVEALRRGAQSLGSVLVSGIVTVTNILVAIVIVVTLTVYFSMSKDGLKGLFTAFAPASLRPFLETLEHRVVDHLGHWFRGQLLLSLIAGVVSYIGLLLLHVPYALLLALIGAFTVFIPVASVILTGVPTVLAAATVSSGTAVAAAVFLLALHLTIAYAVVPRLIGNVVSLNPAVVFAVLLAGAALGGVVGLLLAVPLAATGAVAINLLRQK